MRRGEKLHLRRFLFFANMKWKGKHAFIITKSKNSHPTKYPSMTVKVLTPVSFTKIVIGLIISKLHEKKDT